MSVEFPLSVVMFGKKTKTDTIIVSVSLSLEPESLSHPSSQDGICPFGAARCSGPALQSAVSAAVLLPERLTAGWTTPGRLPLRRPDGSLPPCVNQRSLWLSLRLEFSTNTLQLKTWSRGFSLIFPPKGSTPTAYLNRIEFNTVAKVCQTTST